MNILNSKQTLVKDEFSYFKINSIGYVTGYDAINLPDGMTIYKPDGYIYGTPVKQQTKSSVFFAKNQTENIYKIVEIQVVENSEINLSIPNSINDSPLKITGARYPSGQAVNINLNNILSGYYKSNTGNNYIFGSLNSGYSSYTTQNIIAYNKVYGWGYNNSGQAINGNNLTGISGISAGYDHSLAVFTNLRMTGWGNNNFNKALGGNSLTGVIDVSAGSGHSLALLANKRVTGWGDNTFSQALGGNNLTGVIGISAGAYHSLALLDNLRVTGWGNNFYNQASFGNALTGVRAISAGGFHSLALLANKTVTGWGDNTYSQSSAGNNLTGVLKIGAGYLHGIALLDDGNVTGWGNNEYGQANSACLQTGQGGCITENLNCAENFYQQINGYDAFGCPTYICSPCPTPPNCTNGYPVASGVDLNGCLNYYCSPCADPGDCAGALVITGIITLPGPERLNPPNPVIIGTILPHGYSTGDLVTITGLKRLNCSNSQGNGEWTITAIDNPSRFTFLHPDTGFGLSALFAQGCGFPAATVTGPSQGVNKDIIGYDDNNCPIYGSCNYQYIVSNVGQTLTNVNLRTLAPTVEAGSKVTFYIYGNVGSANAGINNNPSLDTGTWPAGVTIRLVIGPVNGAGCNPNGGVLAGRGQGYCGFEAPNSSRTEAIIVRAGVTLIIENHGVIGGGGGTGGDKGGECGEGGPGAGIPAGKLNTGGTTPQTCCGGEGAASILCGGNGGGGSGSGGGPGQSGGCGGSNCPNNAPQNIILEAGASYSFAPESTRPFFG
jgi:hypothetical protein